MWSESVKSYCKMAVFAIGIVAVVLALALAYRKGAADVQAKWDLAKATAQVKVSKTEVKQADATVKTVVQYVDRVQRVVVKGDTIIKEVPKYVTKQDDARCSIGPGFVSLWNRANSEIPGSAGEADAGAGESGTDQAQGQPAAQ